MVCRFANNAWEMEKKKIRGRGRREDSKVRDRAGKIKCKRECLGREVSGGRREGGKGEGKGNRDRGSM